MNHDKIMIAMSGGVDSSVALLKSIERYGCGNVCGATLALSERGSAGEAADRQNSDDARAVCDIFGVPHMTIYAYPEFSARVIDYFTGEYLAGRTPNPCVVCNRYVKFGLLLDFAREHGYNRIATGHYANITYRDGTAYLSRANDLRKDQSYVLASLSQEQLASADFPLGAYTKPEVRRLAAEHGFVSADRGDSQDVCFIPDGDYAAFIKRRLHMTDEPGDYIDENGRILGQHRGQWQYTIGQRKGLGISMGRHVFVLDKDAERNTVTLGDEEPLFCKNVRVRGVNFISGVRQDGRYTVKLRYAHKPADAYVRFSNGGAELEFDEPQRAPTPGQFAVAYDSDGYVAMSGCICGKKETEADE